jgi:hypothetical protein
MSTSLTNSLRTRVLEAVLGLGECTLGQVTAVVGRHIAASQAATAYRRCRKAERRRCLPGAPTRKTPAEPLERGRRCLVTEALVRLCREGKVRRPRAGLYAPPLPRLFNSA